MTQDEIGAALTDLKIQISTYRAEVTAQNTVTNAKLISIDSHLLKQNGRIGKLEDRVIPLENHCENVKDIPIKIRILEDMSLSNTSVKKFMGVMFLGGLTLGGFIVGLLKLIIG
jgi:hypothetical protein